MTLAEILAALALLVSACGVQIHEEPPIVAEEPPTVVEEPFLDGLRPAFSSGFGGARP